jgi:hypothetical protein
MRKRNDPAIAAETEMRTAQVEGDPVHPPHEQGAPDCIARQPSLFMRLG